MSKIKYDFFLNPNYNNVDKEIYHYTSLEGLHGILTSNSLHFTNIYFLNDRAEMIYTYKVILELISNLEQEINAELYQKIKSRAEYITCPEYYQSESEVLFREDFYIASFSIDPDSLALWNNYTKSVNKIGFNIKFPAYKLVLHIENINKDTSVYYSEVCYDVTEQQEMLKKTILKYNEKWNNTIDDEDRHQIIRDLWKNFIIYSLFFKHPQFAQEKEYRIVIGNISHAEDKKLNFRCQHGLFIPYLQIGFPENKEFQSRILEEIKVSPTCDKSLIKYSIDKLLNNTGYDSLQISYSDIPLRY